MLSKMVVRMACFSRAVMFSSQSKHKKTEGMRKLLQTFGSFLGFSTKKRHFPKALFNASNRPEGCLSFICYFASKTGG